MIIGGHSIIYSKSPEADRAFLRDVLKLPHVDVGEGWLIFGLPPAEVAVHPSDENNVHEFFLMCDDVSGTAAVDHAQPGTKRPETVESLMAELKTKINTASVADYLNSIKDEAIRQDCWAVVDIMKAATQDKPRMWGASIVGFGQYHDVYASGREGDWPVTAFSPRKQNITLYIMPGFERCEDLMAKLGKHTCGKSCLYIKRLSDVHLPTLKKLVSGAVKHMVKVHSRAQRKRSGTASSVAD